MTGGPTYTYILTFDKSEIIQYDWNMYYKPEVELTSVGVLSAIPPDFIGKKVSEIDLPYGYFFTKPK
jgi:hypothetical protein